MVLRAAFLFLLSLALFSCGGGEKVEQAAANEVSGPLDPSDAKNLFILHCESCHGIDGKKGFSDAADLSVSKLNDAEIKNVIRNGNDKGMMPFRDIITTDGELDGVVEFVKTLRKN